MTGADEELARRVAALGRRGHRAVVAGTIRGRRRAVGGWSTEGTTPDGATLFEIGSITKAFTGVLLADMVLSGEVALDDSLSAHLPNLRPAWRHREPTLLELATHLSGLPNTPGAMRRRELTFALGLRRRDPWATLSETDYQRLVAAESPRRAPGTRGRYSSLAVGLLGEALATRAGTSYEQLLTERVLAPLGMADTSVTVPATSTHRLLRGHSRRGRLRPPLKDLMPAAGSLRSTADDMLRFLAACLQPPPGALGEALALAQRPQARLAARIQVGLCWFILSTPAGGRVVWHNGGTWGFRSFAGFAPDQSSAAVVLSNTARSVDRTGLELTRTRIRNDAKTVNLSHQGEYLALARAESVEWVLAAAPGHQPGHEFRVEDDITAGHPSYVGGERGQVGDPVLEEVAHPTVEVSHQPQCVVDLHVLREQHQPDCRRESADLGGRVDALTGEPGRHPQVDRPRTHRHRWRSWRRGFPAVPRRCG